MKILIVGGGGREHAMAWKLGRGNVASPRSLRPGNPGIGRSRRCVPADLSDPAALLAVADSEEVD